MANLSTSNRLVQQQINWMSGLIIGVLVVTAAAILALIFSWGAMVASSSAEKQASYLELSNQVKDQNEKIELLTTQIQELKTQISNFPKPE